MLQNHESTPERFSACRQDINKHILTQDMPMRVGSK